MVRAAHEKRPMLMRRYVATPGISPLACTRPGCVFRPSLNRRAMFALEDEGHRNDHPEADQGCPAGSRERDGLPDRGLTASRLLLA